MDNRFGDWSTKKVEEQPAEEAKENVSEPKKADDTDPKPKEEKLEKPGADDANDADLGDDVEALKAKIKGLEKDVYKTREQKRKLKEELAEKARESAEAKSKESLDVDDFESYEDYEKALSEAKNTAPQQDPVLTKAVGKIMHKAEKLGVDPDELLDSMRDMKVLPASLIADIADRRDGVAIAKWLSENESSEEAYDALNAVTARGADQALDVISQIIKGVPKDDERSKPEKKVATIQKLSGNGPGQRDLNKVSTQEFIAIQSESKRNRFW